MFDADTDRADDRAFAERCHDDRHHFRFIVSPEDAADMADLKGFTRDLVKQMEPDLGTRLDWVAVDHWNTDNPHVHLLVRGVDQTGADLVISRDYISNGLRSRAEDLVGIELGPKPEHEIRSALEKEMTAERWTRLDREIRYRADDIGYIDLRPEARGLDGKVLAGIGTIVFVAVVITATVIEMTRREEPARDTSTPVLGPQPIDPLREEQRRCQQLGEAAASDTECLRVWAETRDRFLGREPNEAR